MYTHITMLIDESGSMGHLQQSVIESIQGLIKKQQDIPEPCTITISTFDTSGNFGNTHWNIGNNSGTGFYTTTTPPRNILRTPIRMANIQSASFTEYHPNGGTPLLEAICREVDATGRDLAALPATERPEKVIFVIMTDGAENSSLREYPIEEVKKRIECQTNTYKWEFLFLGANIDAFTLGTHFGLAATNISTYHTTSVGYTTTTDMLSSKMSTVRTGTASSMSFTPDEQHQLNTTK